jgi:hypothetical protein
MNGDPCTFATVPRFSRYSLGALAPDRLRFPRISLITIYRFIAVLRALLRGA